MELSAVLVAQKESSLKLNVHIATEMRVFTTVQQLIKTFVYRNVLMITLRLDHAHSYYYQVQTQIIVCGDCVWCGVLQLCFVHFS